MNDCRRRINIKEERLVLRKGTVLWEESALPGTVDRGSVSTLRGYTPRRMSAPLELLETVGKQQNTLS